MLTAEEIKNINFSTGFKGYKQEEIDAFLNKIQADYIQYEKVINDYKAQIEDLYAKNKELEEGQKSLQNVLLNAQKLADQIVNDAKEKSEEIILRAEANINVMTSKEKELASAFEEKANERKASLQDELDEMIEKAQLKAKSITEAAEDAVKRQQVLFDKLKLEIAEFKATITAKYKEHLSILQDIPDTVDMDPQTLAELISAKIDAKVDVESFIASKPAPVKEVNEVEDEAPCGFNVEESVIDE